MKPKYSDVTPTQTYTLILFIFPHKMIAKIKCYIKMYSYGKE